MGTKNKTRNGLGGTIENTSEITVNKSLVGRYQF